MPALGIANREPFAPSELWLLPPQHVSLKAPAVGYVLPLEYRYEASGTPQIFPVNQLTGYCDLLHLHGYDPLSAFRSLSPMQSSAWSIDTLLRSTVKRDIPLADGIRERDEQ